MTILLASPSPPPCKRVKKIDENNGKSFIGRSDQAIAFKHFFFSFQARCLCAASSFFSFVFFSSSFAPSPMGAYVSAPVAHCAAAAPPALAAAGDKTAAAASSSSAGSASGSLLPAAAQAAIYGDGTKVRR